MVETGWSDLRAHPKPQRAYEVGRCWDGKQRGMELTRLAKRTAEDGEHVDGVGKTSPIADDDGDEDQFGDVDVDADDVGDVEAGTEVAVGFGEDAAGVAAGVESAAGAADIVAAAAAAADGVAGVDVDSEAGYGD